MAFFTSSTWCFCSAVCLLFRILLKMWNPGWSNYYSTKVASFLLCFTYILFSVVLLYFYSSCLSWPPRWSVFTSWSWRMFSSQCILGTAVTTAVCLCPTSCPDRKSVLCFCSSAWPLPLPPSLWANLYLLIWEFTHGNQVSHHQSIS